MYPMLPSTFREELPTGIKAPAVPIERNGGFVPWLTTFVSPHLWEPPFSPSLLLTVTSWHHLPTSGSFKKSCWVRYPMLPSTFRGELPTGMNPERKVFVWPFADQISVTLSVGTPLSPYCIAYRRVSGLSTQFRVIQEIPE
jgi:hypothetical protein